MIGLAIMLAAQGPTVSTNYLRPGSVTIIGAGEASCAKAWLFDSAQYSRAWVHGYWTGLNAANGRSVGKTTGDVGIEMEVRKRCADHPSATLITAATQAYLALAGRGV